MPKLLTPEDRAIRDARKAEVAKIKKFKHNMEIIRTFCSLLAVVLNVLVLTHVMGFW